MACVCKTNERQFEIWSTWPDMYQKKCISQTELTELATCPEACDRYWRKDMPWVMPLSAQRLSAQFISWPPTSHWPLPDDINTSEESQGSRNGVGVSQNPCGSISPSLEMYPQNVAWAKHQRSAAFCSTLCVGKHSELCKENGFLIGLGYFQSTTTDRVVQLSNGDSKWLSFPWQKPWQPIWLLFSHTVWQASLVQN